MEEVGNRDTDGPTGTVVPVDVKGRMVYNRGMVFIKLKNFIELYLVTLYFYYFIKV